MRRLILAVLAAVCVGCASTNPHPEIINTYGFDFSEYTEEGFLITPEQYLGEYQSIGLIRVVMWPEVTSRSGSGDQYYWQTGDLNVEKAIDEIYKKADSLGANAITRFEITSTSRRNGNIIVEGVEISGFAIKRLDINKSP